MPSVIDDTVSYLAIGRDTASTCENFGDVKNWIEKSQMPSINEECTSIVSDDLTDAMMLNYILNQANSRSLDSGRGESLPYLTESPESAKIDLSHYFDDTNQPQNAEEMSAGNIENNQILPQVHHNNASRETISQMATCSSVSHPLHDHEPVQTFVNTETPSGVVKAQVSTKSSFVAEPTIMPGAYVYYDVESDKEVITPESHPPTLPDQVFTETETDVSCVTTGTYVDSDAALQQAVVSTYEVDKVSLDLRFCSSFQEDVPASASSNVIHEMTTTAGACIDTGMEHIATSPTCDLPLPDNKC